MHPRAQSRGNGFITAPASVENPQNLTNTNTEDVDVRLAGRLTAHVGVPPPFRANAESGIEIVLGTESES